MGRRIKAGAGALILGAMVLIAGCSSTDEPTSLLLSEEELATEPTLRIGEPAPSLVVKQWVRLGQAAPVAKRLMLERAGFPRGQVYVIDFWTSWCGPCLAIMPELDELQARFADAGVVVIAMTALDGMNSRGDVLKVIAADGARRLAFAIDGGPEGNATVQAYLHATRETGVPRTYIVDQQGRLAWIGHPHDAAPVVESLVAGTWDVSAAAAARERDTRERMASRTLVDEWSDARDRGDQHEQLRVLRELTAMKPDNVAMSPSFWMQGEKIKLLREMGDEAGTRAAFAEGMARDEFTKEPWALAEFVKAMASLDPALTDPVALQAEDLATSRDARRPTRTWDAYLAKAERPWDTQARQVLSEYWFARGDTERAIRLIEESLADTDRGYPRAVEIREALLKRYQSAP